MQSMDCIRANGNGMTSWIRGCRDVGGEDALRNLYSGDGVVAILLVYVDDLIRATNNESWKVVFFEDLNGKYGIKDQGRLREYLGIQVDWTEEGVFLHQTKYAKDVLKQFGYGDAYGCRSPTDPTKKMSACTAAEDVKAIGIEYIAVNGSLMYVATSTRPDLAYPVGYLSRFVGNPTVQHGGALKCVLRYVVATTDHGIYFKKPRGDQLEKLRSITVDGYCDSDSGNRPDNRKSVTGYVMMVASGPVAWTARRQSVVAQSTAEAEYVASCEACMEGKSLINILTELLPAVGTNFTLGVDNQAALALASNPTYSRKTRHIDLQFHYVREQVKEKAVKMWKVNGEVNPADSLTKPLGFPRLAKLKALVGMKPDLQPTPREQRRSQYQATKQQRDDDHAEAAHSQFRGALRASSEGGC
ncbi:hypothetical protein PR002_g3993 [Phytophthora rubi]|uniref:Reverse transcriptase Ty1/copia-type domain-containing protein n=1 Tax=Phytophthora rubi TaxID=129364 RepID=A0A6A3NA04_9STRA|nr:hypothetical protein PR002_g3993 [Phytophthora rubi]